MIKLKLTVPIGDGRSATSFMSRVAARNGTVNAEHFGSDIQIPFSRIIAGDLAIIERLADIAGVDPEHCSSIAFNRAVQDTITVGRGLKRTSFAAPI